MILSSLILKAYAAKQGVPIPGTSGNLKYNEYISAVLKYSVRVGLLLATIMIIYAGIKYLTSQGNQTAINDGKEILLGAIIGFVMLLTIHIILRLLGII